MLKAEYRTRNVFIAQSNKWHITSFWRHLLCKNKRQCVNDLFWQDVYKRENARKYVVTRDGNCVSTHSNANPSNQPAIAPAGTRSSLAHSENMSAQFIPRLSTVKRGFALRPLGGRAQKLIVAPARKTFVCVAQGDSRARILTVPAILCKCRDRTKRLIS